MDAGNAAHSRPLRHPDAGRHPALIHPFKGNIDLDALERTIVLNGDGLSAELMDEAAIGRADAVLALSDDAKTLKNNEMIQKVYLGIE